MFKISWKLCLFVCFACCVTLSASSQIVINELYYNPPDDGLEYGGQREFIELYNHGDEVIDLSGYYFDDGIEFTFPEGTRLHPEIHLIIVKSKSSRYWSNIDYPFYGPYEGNLRDSGEQVTLRNSQHEIVDTVNYHDTFPWPLGADGYGASLERIHPDLPSNDYHSWRSSYTYEGTPGRQNSVHEIPAYPMIIESKFAPENPTSTDSVKVQVTLDGPSNIESVKLRYENTSQLSNEQNVFEANTYWRYWRGNSTPSAGQEWAAPSFDDSDWSRGRGGFGYGDTGQVMTVLEDMRGNYSTVYLRKNFMVSQADLANQYALNLYYDDGFIAYLNGTEIARANAPQSYDHTSTASGSHEANNEETFILNTQGILQEGENTLSIVGLNISLTDSSDFVLSPRLAIQDKNFGSLSMSELSASNGLITYEATIPPMDSQNLIRCNIEVTLDNGSQTLLPHTAEPDPFISYFIFDGEITSKLPILWILPHQQSSLLDVDKEISGVVCLQNGQSNPDVFDGAILIPSASQREKVRFLKGQEFYGDRTINIIPEVPTGGTNAGVSSPYREHLGFWFYQEMNVPSPWSEFYRIIRLPINDNTIHRQQLINQQVNERFLEMNDRNPDADLYKLQYSNPNWEKHTNLDEGTDSINFLLMDIKTSDIEKRRNVMEEQLVLEEFLSYSAASIFVSNWDGYWNNNWMYLDPTSKRWEIIPWDLDWVWGATPPPNLGPMYWQMPLSFPIDGVAVGDTNVSRPRGPITAPMHEEPIFYEHYLNKLAQTINTVFTEEKLYTKIESDKQMLLDDLNLIEQQTGRFINLRRFEIEDSYDTIKLYIERRREFLLPLLPTKVEAWYDY